MESTKFLNNLENNKTLMFVVLGAVLFFIFVLPLIDKMCEKEQTILKEKLKNISSEKMLTHPNSTYYSLLDDNMGDIVKIDENRCSRYCCKHTQWPVPHELTNKATEEYIGTNLSCNFGANSGCVCVTKDNFNYLSSRGNNTNNKN